MLIGSHLAAAHNNRSAQSRMPLPARLLRATRQTSSESNAPSTKTITATSAEKDTKLLKTDGTKTQNEKPAITKLETHEAKKGIDAVTSHPNPQNASPFLKIMNMLYGNKSSEPSKDALAAGNISTPSSKMTGLPFGNIVFRRETPPAVTPVVADKKDAKPEIKTEAKTTTPVPTSAVSEKTTPAVTPSKEGDKKVEAGGKKATA